MGAEARRALKARHGVFIALLLLNLAALAWVATRPPPDDHIPTLPAALPDTPPIVTLLERDGPDAVYPDKLRCYSLGPFYKSFEASKAQVRIQELGEKADRRSSKGRELVGFWVYLPPAASKEQAVETTRHLARAGIEDFFIVLAAEKQHAISLGMYKNQRGAEQRMAQIEAKGFQARMEERYAPANIYWLDFEGGWKEPTKEAPWKSILKEFPHIRVKSRPCG